MCLVSRNLENLELKPFEKVITIEVFLLNPNTSINVQHEAKKHILLEKFMLESCAIMIIQTWNKVGVNIYILQWSLYN